MTDATITFRPGPERLAAIEAWAGDLGLKRHAAILALIDLGLRGDAIVPDAAAPALKAQPMRKRAVAPPDYKPGPGVTPKLDTSMVPTMSREQIRADYLARQTPTPKKVR